MEHLVAEVDAIRKHMDDRDKHMEEMMEKRLSEMPGKLADMLTERFEINGVISCTRHDVETIAQAKNNEMLEKFKEMLDARVGPAVSAPSPPTPAPCNLADRNGGIGLDGYVYYVWDGRNHPVPKGWAMPILNCSNMFDKWIVGNQREKIRPYRDLVPQNLQSTLDDEGARKLQTNAWRTYLSKTRFVMSRILQGMSVTAEQARRMPTTERDSAFRTSFFGLMKTLYPDMRDGRFNAKRFGDLSITRVYDRLKPGRAVPKKRKKHAVVGDDGN